MWWQWLNPMNWIKVFGYVKTFLGVATAIFEWFRDVARKREQAKEIKKIEDAEKALDEANQIEDENERLKKKAAAVCEIEKSFNPKSDCGA